MSEEQVLQFANAAKFLMTEDNAVSRCVDGRYEGLSVFPGIAKPGGDAGDVLVAFGAINKLGQQIDTGLLLQTVVGALGGPSKFNFHTDEHAVHDHAPAGMGCGHIKLAQKNPDAYGVTQEQIDSIFTQLPTLIEQGAHQEVLHGDHAEQAVLVVHSTTHSLKPLVKTSDGELQEAFIYQQTLHAKQLDVVARKLQELFAAQGVVLEEPAIREALDNAFGVQLQQTLQALAKDLPVYTVSIDESGEIEIK